jgi:acetolactate synthase I/II/III large subunit
MTTNYTQLPLRQLGDQEFDIIQSVKNMTKYAVQVNDPSEIRYHLEKAC